MKESLSKLGTVLSIPTYRRLGLAVSGAYLLLFLVALQDISAGGRGLDFLTTNWDRMFDRTGTLTFEPVARVTFLGVTILVSPLNILLGAGLSLLAGSACCAPAIILILALTPAIPSMGSTDP
jgi:hypothetical protein